MDYQQEGPEEDSQPGVRRIDRVVATFDGETHIYQYPPREWADAVRVVKAHVEEDRLHPYAGVMLIKMIREMNNGD